MSKAMNRSPVVNGKNQQKLLSLKKLGKEVLHLTLVSNSSVGSLSRANAAGRIQYFHLSDELSPDEIQEYTFSLQAACCAAITDLVLNETNAYQVVQIVYSDGAHGGGAIGRTVSLFEGKATTVYRRENMAYIYLSIIKQSFSVSERQPQISIIGKTSQAFQLDAAELIEPNIFTADWFGVPLSSGGNMLLPDDRKGILGTSGMAEGMTYEQLQTLTEEVLEESDNYSFSSYRYLYYPEGNKGLSSKRRECVVLNRGFGIVPNEANLPVLQQRLITKGLSFAHRIAYQCGTASSTISR